MDSKKKKNARFPPFSRLLSFLLPTLYSLHSMMTRGKGILAILSRACDLGL